MLAALNLVADGPVPDWTGITADSRHVRPGMLFAALTDQPAYVAQAVAAGAAAVLAGPGLVWPAGTPSRPRITSAKPRRALAQLAALNAGPPPATVIAITGTNGKTSTAEFLRQILGAHAASIGTLGVITAQGVASAGDVASAGGLTTPDPVALADTMASLARDGVRAVAIEASSHGLDQHRLDGLTLAAAGFTNLTRDHLDYHGSEAAYRAAKLRLFTELLPRGAPAVTMADLDGDLRALIGGHTVGIGGSLIRLISSTPHAGGQTLVLDGRTIELPLPGRFQVDNALLAAGLAMVTGVHDALDRLPALRGVRGRMELAATIRGAAVYVDYAHTPDALTRLLQSLRPHTKGRLQIVFGAGGDRDRGKRPLMGAAARLADLAIVTDDNPRTEDPAAIRAAVLAGNPGAREIGDRATAIAAAIDDLRPGDVLVVAGKGHEQGQAVGRAVIPFDDVSVVRMHA